MKTAHLGRMSVLCAALLATTGCSGGLDMDLRGLGSGVDTSEAALASRTQDRPRPDSRGVISYPDFQVAVARSGDTLADIAARVNLPAAELARFNGIPENAQLRAEEVVALPRRVSEPSPATGVAIAGPIRPAGEIDVATLAGNAIDRASGSRTAAAAPQTGDQPIRHRVAPGETAFSIARRYGVSVQALEEWNGLGRDMTVRIGQYLLIPPVAAPARAPVQTAAPGRGSVSPAPPSAAEPLPEEDEAPVASAPPPTPTPDLSSGQTAASDTAPLVTPVPGRIVRGFEKGEYDGIRIAAPAGTPVRAADAGTVAAITRDTDQVPIVVLRHADNLLTVYSGLDDLKVEKGDRVSRGQTIAAVRPGDLEGLHFEVRRGFDSLDPVDFLN